MKQNPEREPCCAILRHRSLVIFTVLASVIRLVDGTLLFGARLLDNRTAAKSALVQIPRECHSRLTLVAADGGPFVTHMSRRTSLKNIEEQLKWPQWVRCNGFRRFFCA